MWYPFQLQVVAIYILYAVCTQTSVSFFVIRRDLVLMELVKCVMSGGVETAQCSDPFISIFDL
jgi:hypothetical protein